MHSFNSCFQRMHLIVSTDTKLDQSHSSITCLSVFDRAFAVQISFCIILHSNFWGGSHLGWSKTFPMLWNLEDFQNATSWNSEFLGYCLLTHILGHLHPHFLGNFCLDFRFRIFTTLKKNKMKICILAVEHFPVLKHCILIGLYEAAENFSAAIF